MFLSRRSILKMALLPCAWESLQKLSHAAALPDGKAVTLNPDEPVFPAPDDPREWPAFRTALNKWRRQARETLHYDDTLYRRKDFEWVPASFACGFVMLCDETFYSPRTRNYWVEQYLDTGKEAFGGYDSIVLWHAYPRIGLDERNQFDFYRDMPGGLKGLREVSRRCHRRGVKVFIDYNPWDTGTRRESQSDVDALVDLVGATETDGIFLDTMAQGAEAFRQKLDAVRPGVVLEGEIALPPERIHDHLMSWAQGFGDSETPGVLRNKWFERRHIQHQIRRWDLDHTAEMHMAWMNGSGMMIWENVFGSWMEWSERDRSLLRSMLPIQRRYRDLFSGEGWTPLVETLQPQIYASRWEGDELKLWALVNRSEKAVEGELLLLHDAPGPLYDLIRGEEANMVRKGGRTSIAGSLPPRGIACYLAGEKTAPGRDFEQFLSRQKRLHQKASTQTHVPARKTVLKVVPSTRKYSRDGLPDGMLPLPDATFNLTTLLKVRECGFYESVHDAFRSPNAPPFHSLLPFHREVSLSPYAMDRTPVTNAQFLVFLSSTHYKPRHFENFLKHWQKRKPPSGKEDHPVVYVDLEDARAYTKWAGKRLPSEEEWQFAAEGPEALRYPWGMEMNAERCNGGEKGGTTSVTAYPEGRSPFGILDLCGNIWEWTESERSEGRTRFAMLKGGSYFHAEGSGWYFDGGPQPSAVSVKMLLMWAGLDRCATVGFRCVADLAPF